MDPERLNTIIREVIELDPTLQSEEAHLRAYMKEFDVAKPHVVIDETFVERLRNTLTTSPRPIPSPYTNIGWWVFRLTPVGIVALLFLILMPQAPSPTVPAVEEDAYRDTRIIDIGTGSDTSAPAPYFYEGGAADTSIQTESTMNMKSAAGTGEVHVSQIFSVSPQPIGPRIYIDIVRTDRPGFIVMDSGMGGEPFGVSPLISPGTTERLPINVYIPETPEHLEMFALFYFDNGDRIYNELDMAEQDEFGTILWTPVPLY